VPADKYLRIEYVTFAEPELQDSLILFEVETSLPGATFVRHYLPHTNTGVSQLVRIYASPGSTVAFRLTRRTPCAAVVRGSFSGVLVDAS
jgi:hypothetical protein